MFGLCPFFETNLCHDILVEGEGDVGAATLWVTPGSGRGLLGVAPALTLAGTWFDEAALVPHGDTGVTGWTLRAVSLTVEAAGPGSTHHLRDQRQRRLLDLKTFYTLKQNIYYNRV